MRIVVGISGATGAIYAIKLLEVLKQKKEAEVHLIISNFGKENIKLETDSSLEYVYSLADHVYKNEDLAAQISSGSFKIDACVVLPCSMKTLSSIANGYSDSLISRSADVAIKEGRKLIICPRESPLNAIHLENMLKLSRIGVSIIPPMPAFYNKPSTIDDIIGHHIMKVIDRLGLEYEDAKRWSGC